MQDKRQHRRVVLDIEVACQPAAGEAFQATAKDISVGGMFLTTVRPPLVGGAMTVEVRLPGQDKPILFPAFVRWVNAEGFGIQFDLLGAKATHAITRLMR